MSLPSSAVLPPEPAEAAPAASLYHQADDHGLYQQYEKIGLPRMPVGTAGELRLAHVAGDEHQQAGFYPGWWLHIRSPRNTSEQVPSELMPFFSDRTEALLWLIDEIALKFYSDHKGAIKALRAWRETLAGEAQKAAPTETAAPAAAPVEPAAEQSAERPVTARLASIPVDQIEPNPHNPRKSIDPQYIAELAASIKAQGFLLQPIAVRDMGQPLEGSAARRYRLLAGERRWRAHQELGWTEIEAKVFIGVSEAQAEELALIENLQRRNINPMEEAHGYAELRDRHGYSIDKISEKIGRKVPTIEAALRLVELPQAVAEMVRSGQMKATTARGLTRQRWLARPKHCARIAEWIVVAGKREEDLNGIATQLPRDAAEFLAAAGLAIDVSNDRSVLDATDGQTTNQHTKGRGSDVMPDDTGRLWHLDPAFWRQEKAARDKAWAEREARERAREMEKVEAAREHDVNVRVADIPHLQQVVLDGELVRYARYLPKDCVHGALTVDGRETLVCLAPAKLDALRDRERAMLAEDRDNVLGQLYGAAQEEIRRVEAIGPRELAVLVEGGLGSGGGLALDPEACEEMDALPPANLDLASLGACEPLALVRAVLWATLVQATGTRLENLLRHLLGMAQLGLATETEAGRERILAAAAREVFGAAPVTDPAILAQWQKAHALNMPLTEIARSYGVTVDEVRGALEL